MCCAVRCGVALHTGWIKETRFTPMLPTLEVSAAERSTMSSGNGLPPQHSSSGRMRATSRVSSLSCQVSNYVLGKGGSGASVYLGRIRWIPAVHSSHSTSSYGSDDAYNPPPHQRLGTRADVLHISPPKVDETSPSPFTNVPVIPITGHAAPEPLDLSRPPSHASCSSSSPGAMMRSVTAVHHFSSPPTSGNGTGWIRAAIKKQFVLGPSVASHVKRAAEVEMGVHQHHSASSPMDTSPAPTPEDDEQEHLILERVGGHPNVIPMHGTFLHSGYRTIVLPLMDSDIGYALKHLSKGSSAPGAEPDAAGVYRLPNLAQVRWLMKGILGGLEHIHSRGVAHRDIKPSNVFLTKCSTVWTSSNAAGDQLAAQQAPPVAFMPIISDFNVAHYCDDRPRKYPIQQRGTKFYQPPECLMGRLKPTEARSADLWSVGCLLIEMLTGTPAFPGETAMDMLQLIFTQLDSSFVDFPLQKGGLQTPWGGALVDDAQLPGRDQWPPLGHRLEVVLPPLGVDFVLRLLCLDPSLRMSCTDALQHPFMKSQTDVEPAPWPVACFPDALADSALRFTDVDQCGAAMKFNSNGQLRLGWSAQSSMAPMSTCRRVGLGGYRMHDGDTSGVALTWADSGHRDVGHAVTLCGANDMWQRPSPDVYSGSREETLSSQASVEAPTLYSSNSHSTQSDGRSGSVATIAQTVVTASRGFPGSHHAIPERLLTFCGGELANKRLAFEDDDDIEERPMPAGLVREHTMAPWPCAIDQ